MKKNSILLLLIAILFCGSAFAAQKDTVLYYQNFESAGSIGGGYTPKNATIDTHHVSSIQCILIKPSGRSDAYIEIGPIKISGKYKYGFLDFSHICKLAPSDYSLGGGNVQYSWTTNTNWSDFDDEQYVYRNNQGADGFEGAFRSTSYPGSYDAGWDDLKNTVPTNKCWKNERFNFSLRLQINNQDKILYLKFRAPQYRTTDTVTRPLLNFYGWLVDNIKIAVSEYEMDEPKITMINYPDPILYPSSDTVKIRAKITDANAGFNTNSGIAVDSVYVNYKVGGSPVWHTSIGYMAPNTAKKDSLYEIPIPFYGYDTLITWRLTAVDSSLNFNRVTFPYWDTGACLQFKSVRGAVHSDTLQEGPMSSQTSIFSSARQGRFQYIYDSALLKKKGFKAGNITGVSFLLSSTPTLAELAIDNFTIKMMNVSASYKHEETSFLTSADLRTVYSGRVVFPKNSGDWFYIPFLNSNAFKWNGEGDILLQICYDSTNVVTTSYQLRSFDVATGKKSHESPTSPIADPCNRTANVSTGTRPVVAFKMQPNFPSIEYDAGISAIVQPAVSVPADSWVPLMVELKNYGTKTIDSVEILYVIDGIGPPTSVKWNKGNLAAYSTVVADIGTVKFSSGFKTIEAWTGGWINTTIRDHEPLNDTARSELTACAGALRGERFIGGSGNQSLTYGNFTEAFDMLKNCGIDTSVTFSIAEGIGGYWNTQLEFPTIPGLDGNKTITFQPQSGKKVRIKYNINDENKNWLVHFGDVSNIIFKNITFEIDAINADIAASTSIIYMGMQNNNIVFDSCEFIINSPNVPKSVINVGSASNAKVINSIFTGKATTIVSMQGLNGNYSNNNVVSKNKINIDGITGNIIDAKNQKNIKITQNNIESASASSNAHAIYLTNVSDSIEISKNRIILTNALSGISISTAAGSSNRAALVANNMISLIGKKNLYGISLSEVSNLKLVYNSLLIDTGNSKSSIALSIGTLDNTSVVENNIFANYSGVCVSSGSVNFNMDYNSYYSTGNFGNFKGVYINNLTTWQDSTGADAHSMIVNPLFASSTELKTIAFPLAKGGTPIVEVIDDFYGALRNPTTPSLGALQFSTPKQSASVLALVSPLEGCNLDTNEVITIKVQNVGSDIIPAGELYVSYKIGNQESGIELANPSAISVGDTLNYSFSKRANLSVSGIQNDYTYNIKIWCVLAGDDYKRDDTVAAQIVSYYQLPKPTVTHASDVEYGQTDTLKATPVANAVTYWYTDSLASYDDYFFKGDTLITSPIIKDTTFYASQKRELPLLRFTEFQLLNDKPGATDDSPLYISKSSTRVIELANLGNGSINLKGYSVVVTGTSTPTISLPDLILKGGEVFTIQSTTPPAGSSSYTMQSSIPITYTTQATVRLLYNGTAIDAFKINAGASSVSVPTSLWTGTLTLSDPNCPGIRRINPYATDSSGWVICNAQNKGSIGSVEDKMIVYRDNGCSGYKTKVNVKVRQVPDYEPSLDNIFLSNENTCNLKDESVSVVIRNHGTLAISSIPVKYYVNGVLKGDETVPSTVSIQPDAQYTYTFNTQVNLFTRVDTQYTIMAIVNYLGDVHPENDTIRTILNARKSTYPVNDTTLEVDYGTAGLLKLSNNSIEEEFIWYDWNKTPLNDTNIGFYKIPFKLFTDTAYYVKPIVVYPYTRGFVGTATTYNQPSAYPAVYSSKNRFARHQIIVTASQLRAMGYSKGDLNSISFYVDSVPAGGVVLKELTIAIGKTGNSSFGSQSYLPLNATDSVYFTDRVTFVDTGWYEHKFRKPFYWNGDSNLIIQTNTVGADTGKFVRMRYTNDNNDVVNYRSSNDSINIAHSTQGNGISQSRNNMRFGFSTYGCVADDYTRVNVKLKNTPGYDLQMLEVVEPLRNNSSGDKNITVAIRNNGSDAAKQVALSLYINSVKILISTPTLSIGNTSAGLLHGEIDTVTVATNFTFSASGSDTIKVVLDSLSSDYPVFSRKNDSYRETDTVSKIVSVCLSGGTYTIGKDTSDYPTFTEAVKTLVESGICGTVIFKVRNGEYKEQISIPYIYGASSSNTILFQSENGDSSKVKLTYKPQTVNTNYVLQLDNASYVSFKGITIYADTSSALKVARAVVVKGDSVKDISFTSNVIEVTSNAGRYTADTTQTNTVYVEANLSGFIFENNSIRGGLQALVVRPKTAAFIINGVSIKNNRFENFLTDGTILTNVRKAVLFKNYYDSRVFISNSMRQAGIVMAHPIGDFRIEKNIIILTAALNNNNLKTGIHIYDGIVDGSQNQNSIVANNMISVLNTKGTGSIVRGVSLERSNFIKFIYNSILVRSSIDDELSQINTRCFYSDDNRNITIWNNNFQLIGVKNACVVEIRKPDLEVADCDYNNYYCNATGDSIAKWGYAYYGKLVDLKNGNDTMYDQNSVNIRTDFINDTNNLRLKSPDLAGKALADNDVQDDIDGLARPKISNPCIGAQEKAKTPYDVGIKTIIAPDYETTEYDGSLVTLVRVKIKNYGTEPITTRDSVRVWVCVISTQGVVSTTMKTDTLLRLSSSLNQDEELTVDLPKFSIPWQESGTKSFIAYTTMSKDTISTNDTLRGGRFRVGISYDLFAEKILSNINGQCKLHAASFGLTIVNKGGKTILPTEPIIVGLTIDRVVKFVDTLYTTLASGSAESYYFKKTVDLYPYTSLKDSETYRLMAFCKFANDYNASNDTTNGNTNGADSPGNSLSVTSYKTPTPPAGSPNSVFSFPYATIGSLRATQTFNNTETNEIYWFAYKGSSDVLKTSTSYSTPQLFADRVYYLQTKTRTPSGVNACWSDYDSIIVKVTNRPQVDVGCIKVIEPFERLTYMEKGDSVKVRIKNYGLQTVSNIPVTFRGKNITKTTKDQLFTENCEASIEPGGTYDFTFKTDFFITLYEAANYKLTAWTGLSGDNTAMNDTVNLVRNNDDYLYPKSDTLKYIIAENEYDASCKATVPRGGLKITNVSYGLFNSSTAALANAFSLMIGQNGVKDTAAIFYKGYADTMSISASYYDPYVVNGGDSAYIKVFIDWNRNTLFENTEMVFGSKIKVEKSTATVNKLVTIPETVKTGFCRMRVILQMDADSNYVLPTSSFLAGEREDYKIWIRPPYEVNLALEKVITPSDTLGGINPGGNNLPVNNPTEKRSVKILLRNLGTAPVTSATLHWKYNDGEIYTKAHTTNLGLFQFDTVNLGEYDFPYGTTSLCAWLEYPNNNAFKNSDTITKQFHRVHTLVFNYDDDFDAKDYFYALGGSEYNPNIWQKGKPNKGYWKKVVTEPNAWVTDSVNQYKRDNESYLYSPYFYTGFVKPDSLIFMMIADVLDSAYLRVEYLSASNKWTGITDATATWYSDIKGFNKAFSILTGGAALDPTYKKTFTRMNRYEANVGNYTQFRFVFRCEPTAANIKNGFAIDNFKIVRAKLANDVGVISIVKPDSVSYGSKFGPQVEIQNFGTDTAYNIRLEYNCLSGTVSYIPKRTTWDGALAPDAVTEYTFTAEKDKFLVDKHFKDSLLLCAYTDMSNNDLYKDNDTTYRWAKLKLLGADVGIDSKINPPDTVVIQSISDIIVRVHNYGAYPVQEIPIILYNENTKETFREMVRLPEGRPIMSNEIVEFAFKEKYQAFFGVGWLRIFTGLPSDEYHMNDTMRVKIYATNNVSDLVGEHIYRDESDPNYTTVAFAFMNKGDKKVNNIPIAYYIDNDPSTVIRETYTAADVAANQLGYHIFSTRLPKRAQPYFICAFTDLPDENNRINDTTCNTMPIDIDMAAAYMNIEESDRYSDCRVRIVTVNKGNYPVTSAKISISVDGGAKILDTTLTGKHLVPGDTLRFTFDGEDKIAKSSNSTYSIVGSITTANDRIRYNDTTRRYYVVSNIPDVSEVVIEIDEKNALELAQNYPNPFEHTTKIPFRIPGAGMVRFFVYDLMGKTIFETTGHYSEGEHIYTFRHKNLPSGIYYYGIEFNKERLVKKMVIL